MRLKISQIVVIVGLLFSGPVAAEEQWWAYLSGQENGPSSTRVDLSFKKLAPVTEYPFVVVTGITYEKINPEGLPRHDVLTCPSSTIVGYRWGRANNP